MFQKQYQLHCFCKLNTDLALYLLFAKCAFVTSFPPCALVVPSLFRFKGSSQHRFIYTKLLYGLACIYICISSSIFLLLINITAGVWEQPPPDLLYINCCTVLAQKSSFELGNVAPVKNEYLFILNYRKLSGWEHFIVDLL